MTETLTPHHIASTCMCLAMQRAARRITKTYDDALRHVGLTSGQFSLLVAVSGAPELGLVQLAEKLGMDRTTLTASLKPLERDGLIVRHADPTDARTRHLRLSESGQHVLDSALPLWASVQSKLQDQIGASDFRQMRQGLSSLS